MSFNGKVIAITGGGQGIGLATAKVLAGRGASVSIADANPTTLEQVQKDFEAKGWPIHTAVVDIRDPAKVNAWIEGAVAKFGRLDGAVNAAGIIGKSYGQAKIADIQDDEWDLVLGVNVNGMLYSLRAELKHIVDGGSIVNISSNQGSAAGFPGCAAYTTSKHAVLGLTKSAARDYGSRGIRINAVGPGGTYGPLMHSVVGDSPPPATNALEKYAKPEEIAYMIVWLLGPESTHTSGELLRVDGGLFA
ncbi:hypothetical protein SEUCBS139899_003004 [Sporothrix eucalyptigena]|uniref:Ketoreductase domain-containing protein n=1 Tax=Sporothrix eucalyptigena TaxID=1812306 RepID=A0ABP0CA44_9PEZI